MTTARKDVLLVIQAKDTSQRALDAAKDSLRALFEAQDDLSTGAELTGSKLLDLASDITAVERAYNSISVAQTKAESAFARQTANLSETKAQLAAVKGQLAAVAREIEVAQQNIVSANLGQSPLDRFGNFKGADEYVARLKAAQAAQASLAAQERKLSTSSHVQEAAIGQARNSLQQLHSAANAAEVALIEVGGSATSSMLAAKAATERETAALREQAAAAREAAEADRARGRFDAMLGVRNAAPSGAARRSAEVFEAEARAADELARKAAKLRATLNPVAAAQAEVNAKLAEAERLYEAGAISLTEYALAKAKVRQEGDLLVAELDGTAAAMRAIEAAAQETARAEENMAHEAQDLRNKIDPLAAIQARLNRELARARELYRANKISADELATAESHLAAEATEAAAALERQGRGGKGAPGSLGLKPYELTNLGYQVNDVFTQLASGTSLTQTLAQQGGQLLQLFPKVGSAIVSALGNPVILGAVASMGLVAAGLMRVREEAGRLRRFEGLLTSLGDEARYTGRQLTEATREFERYGMRGADAEASLRTFVRSGINPEYIRAFGKTAQDMVDVLPDSFDDASAASRALSEGFSGNYDDLMRLQEATHFMTVEEAAQIRTMFDHGRQAEALRRAFEILRTRMGEAAEQARGASTEANRSLGRSFDNLLDKMSRTGVVRGMASALDGVANAMERIGNATDGVRTLSEIDHEISEAERHVRESRASIAHAGGRTVDPFGYDTPAKSELDNWTRRLAELRAERTRIDNSQSPGAGSPADPNSQAARARREAIERETAQSIEQLNISRQLTEAQRLGNRQLAVRLAGEREYRRVLAETHNATRAAAARLVAEREEGGRQDQEAEERARRGGQMTTFAHPLGGAGRETSGFGWRTDPIHGNRRFHNGVDYAAPTGTPVYATGDGRIDVAGRRPNGYGIQVVLDMGDVEDLFGHLSRVAVRAGQQVRQGDLIGYVGSTGRSTGSHLHQRRMLNGRAVDPRLNTVAETNPAQAATEGERAQENLNRSLEDERLLREMNVRQAQELVGLSGDALFDAMRRHTVERAVHSAEQQALRAGVELEGDRRAEIERTVVAEFDLANARDRAQRPIEELSGERETLIERLRESLRDGDSAAVTRLGTELQRVDGALEQAIANGQRFWESQGDTPEARANIHRLATLRSSLDQARIDVSREQLGRLETLREELVQGINRAFDQGDTGSFLTLDGQLRDVEQSLRDNVTALEAFWRAKGDTSESRSGLLELAEMRSRLARTAAEIYQHRVDTLNGERQALVGRVETIRRTGGGEAELDRLAQQIAAVDAQLEQAIASASRFWAGMAESPERTRSTAALEEVRDGIRASAEDMRRAPTQEGLDRLRAQRDALQSQMEFFRDQGMMEGAEALREQIRRLDAEILPAIDHLVELWQVSGRPEAQASIYQLQNMRNEVAQAGREFAVTAGQIQEAFAGELVDSVTQWADAIGSGQNAIRATWDMFRSFAADFMRQMAMMLLQQAAMKLAMKMGFGRAAGAMNAVLDATPLIAAGGTLTAAGGTLTGAGATLTASGGTLVAASASWMVTAAQIMVAAQMLMAANAAGGASGAGVFHSGGVVGSGGRVRSVWPGIFRAATRYHSGGIAGLAPREVPAILERGEEVLTRGDPRHILNGGGAGDATGETTVNLKNVNVFDSADALEHALSSRIGEKVMMNFVRRNGRAFKSAMGDS